MIARSSSLKEFSILSSFYHHQLSLHSSSRVATNQHDHTVLFSISRTLDCSVVLALFSTNSSFVYMLSWVVLHKQFVGIRIMAVILSTTGISLLAYMDGVADNKTLGAVLIASGAAVGSAIYKVMFKKVMGEVSLGQAIMEISQLTKIFLHHSGLPLLQPHRDPEHGGAMACGNASLSNRSRYSQI